MCPAGVQAPGIKLLGDKAMGLFGHEAMMLLGYRAFRPLVISYLITEKGSFARNS